jgi:hypothetical protein
VQILEQRVPVGALQLVDRLDAGLGIARAVARPGGEQRGGEIGDRPAHRLRQVLLGDRVFLLLERVHADHQPGDAVVLVELTTCSASRTASSTSPSASTDRKARSRSSCSSDRRAAPRGNRRGGAGVALRAGVARGEIAAGRRQRASSVADGR